MMTTLRDLPSVEELLQTQTAAELIAQYGRPLTLSAIRETLDKIRTRFTSGAITALPLHDLILAQTDALLSSWVKPTLRPVINATGVILHTNLGRAPLSDATIHAMDGVSRGYSNLEYDLEKGARGSRLIHAESVLQKLTGAESAIIVNNNASAVLLVLSALANKKRVVISRSQLVEIGGGFRIPDVMKQSGAKLVEVGTTNKVHLQDYEDALQDNSALVMHAHSSNFKIIGFTEEPELKEVAQLAHKAGVYVVDDLGSGALVDTLLGGPQAGIILGRKDLIDKIKKHPLARAVRADKACLAGVTATLLHYLKDEAEREIPILKMMSLTPQQVKGRVDAWIRELDRGEVVEGESTVGGGSLPGESFPTFLLSLTVESPDRFLKRLRVQNPPIIARTTNDKVLLDPRTVLPEQEGALLVGLENVLEDSR
jgi:L-seryl-tRNA(Ser) seleniumtransferase